MAYEILTVPRASNRWDETNQLTQHLFISFKEAHDFLRQAGLSRKYGWVSSIKNLG